MSEGLPEGWAKARLGDLLEPGGLFDGPFGSSLKTSDYTDQGVRVIRLENVANLRFVGERHTYISHAKYSTLKKHTVGEGDLIVGSFVDGAVRVCLLPALSTTAIAKADCFCVRTCHELERSFLAFQLATDRTRDALVEDIHGATRPRITTRQLREFEVVVAPPSEQRRIVEKVETLLAHVNSARARLANIPTILQRFRQAVLGAACSGSLTAVWRKANAVEPLEVTLSRVRFEQSSTGRSATDDVIPGQYILSVGMPDAPPPENWKWVPLLQVARLESGHTPTRRHPEYWVGDTPWIGIQDAREHHGGYISETRQHVNDAGLRNSAARLLPANTVCLSRTASVGYVVIMARPMATSQDFVNWVCSKAVVPEFLMYALMAEGEGIRRFGRGTTHTTIYFPEVKALHICLPPVGEQQEIVRRVRSLLKLAEPIDRRVAAATARTDKLTQTVLAKAFRGELVATEAELAHQEGREYEPAGVLLKRVRAECAAAAEGARGTRRGRRPSTSGAQRRDSA